MNIVDCTFYQRMNIENYWNHHKKGNKVERRKVEEMNQFGL
jgi:hypothetical protein